MCGAGAEGLTAKKRTGRERAQRARDVAPLHGVFSYGIRTLFRCLEGMKILIALYAANNSRYQFEPIFDGRSAFERSFDWALSFSQEAQVLVLADSENEAKIRALSANGSAAKKCHITVQNDWSAAATLEEIAKHAKKNDCKTVLFALSSCPFYCTALTEYIVSHHTRYACEYTFADGYAAGLAPSAIHADSLVLAANLARGKTEEIPITANLFFDVIQSDINSFEVETVISPEDVRMYRLNFSCISKQTLLACKALFDSTLDETQKNAEKKIYKIDEYSALEICQRAIKNESVLRTVPSFYNIQISCYAQSDVIYSPYWNDYYEKNGHYPNEAPQKNPDCFMNKDSFAKLIDEIAELSGEAVVSLSAWGEPLAHPDFCSFVQLVLAHEGLSLVVETDGLLLTEALLTECKKIVDDTNKSKTSKSKTGGEKRKNGHHAIYWIVALDAMTKAKYGTIHLAEEKAETNFAVAVNAFELLQKHFPASAYPQFTRMNENEDELESFYRSYKAKGNVLIQKYNWFSGRLVDRRPADLSPLVRIPCWHRLRDLVVLANGNVPNCREYSLSEEAGNAFTLGATETWNRSGQQGNLCKECDEYYTFNF
ncbi:MAG: spiro-SPASM protein [Treponemataceae bacterium]|nr:MAG: spiro-SPASM protein [Treponemataceae bacterium]